MTIKALVEMLQELAADYGEDIPVRIVDGGVEFEAIHYHLDDDDKLILWGEYDD